MTPIAQHVFKQGPVLSAMVRIVASPRKPSNPMGAEGGSPVSETVAPRSPKLVRDYAAWCGADPASYADTIPPHLFPHWTFPTLVRALGGLPYRLTRVLNQGCQLHINGPLPLESELAVSAQVVGITTDEFKARIHQTVRTGPPSQPDAVVADVYSVVPLARRPDSKKREPLCVPDSAQCAGTWSAGSRAGLQFATLTGDFNPIHWLGPYARMAGFQGTILHGFATLARSYEILASAGDTLSDGPIRRLDVRFIRPFSLPATVGVYLTPGDTSNAHALTVGQGVGEPALLVGTVETAGEHHG